MAQSDSQEQEFDAMLTRLVFANVVLQLPVIAMVRNTRNFYFFVS
ncbi:MAG: hypothetical protein WCW33_04850 [Candidatus Babeliales bacterium]|jgi:hypothetical protein